MRKTLWYKYSDDLQLQDCEIDVSKEDVKKFGEN